MNSALAGAANDLTGERRSGAADVSSRSGHFDSRPGWFGWSSIARSRKGDAASDGCNRAHGSDGSVFREASCRHTYGAILWMRRSAPARAGSGLNESPQARRKAIFVGILGCLSGVYVLSNDPAMRIYGIAGLVCGPYPIIQWWRAGRQRSRGL